MPSVLSDSNARLAAARRLTGRRARRETGRFLAEGIQSVREALAAPGVVLELFVTGDGFTRHHALLETAAVPASIISDRAAGALSETVTPQGIVAVCRMRQMSLEDALATSPRLVAVLVEANDPGNAGTILRTADAAGAEVVVFAGDSVDPYNGKAVRASAGSLFHVTIVTEADPVAVLRRCAAAGLHTLATSGHGGVDLDDLIDAGELARPVAWAFGNEARGLSADVLAAADVGVRVPIHGRAESLNLAAAAAVCLYSSARAHRRG